SKQLSSAPSVAIVGAGIGGVTTAWHCQRYGMDVTLFEAEAPAAGASGNPIGLLMPRVEANDTPSARFFRDAFLYALQFYHVTAPEHIKVMGGTIAPDQDRPSRFVKLMSSHMWHKDDFHLREDGSLFVTHGATLSPKKTIHKILGYGNIHVQRKRVTSIQQDHRSPVSLYSDENCVWHGDHVVIANGVHAHQFMKFNGMLKASRGQIDIFKGSPPSHIITSGSYIAPFGNNIAAGATYDDISLEEPINIDQTSTEKNKAAAKLLSDHDNIGDTLSSRASVRATTQDRYPIMGHVSPPAALPANAVWGVTGLGSHGLSTGPYLGAHIAHQLAGTISPLPPSALKLIEPMRFQKRKARQEKSS
ncbi:MAG: FAD-dependent 5-carboxymethylaminomethyl-2-thiouridine(34) oxidoreductase MnmC, partial [Pseudomonadota bacterium]